MAGRPRLTPEQQIVRLRVLKEQARERYAAQEVDTTYLRMFEENFSSETKALDNRGTLVGGTHLGNGCRWIRPVRNN